MVKFLEAIRECEVRIKGKELGHINEDGFFIGSTTTQGFIKVSSRDLRAIADKVEEIKKKGGRV